MQTETSIKLIDSGIYLQDIDVRVEWEGNPEGTALDIYIHDYGSDHEVLARGEMARRFEKLLRADAEAMTPVYDIYKELALEAA